MKPKRVLTTPLFALIICVALCLAFAFVWIRWVPPEWKYHREMARAEALVREVEVFRATQGKLPASSELSSDQLKTTSLVSGPVSISYHLSKDGQEYTLMMIAGFDETYVYSPDTRKWLRTD